MNRTLFAMASLGIMAAWLTTMSSRNAATTVWADDKVQLPSGKKIEGELIGEKRPTPWIGFVDSYYGHMTDIPVTLKAGDKITIQGTVTGRGRKIAIALLDPAGVMIEATKRDTHVASARLGVDEVSASGSYTIRLVSDRIGAYTLTATYPESSKPRANGEDGGDSEISNLDSGETYEGELSGERKPTRWLGFVDSYYGYMTDLPVTLKAGDKVTIRGSVTGKGRKIAIALLDPSGEMIEATKRNTDVGSTQLIAEEVNATGKYVIRVVSDRIGTFKLTAIYPEAKSKKKGIK